MANESTPDMLLSQREEGQGSVPIKPVSGESSNSLRSQVTERIYVFGEYRLDSQDRRLWHRGTPVPLAPKALDLLHVFLQRPGQLITKEELLRTVWPSSFVEEANLTVYVSALRKAFGRIDSEVEFIETIPKWGYRFTATVTHEPEEADVLPAETIVQEEPLPAKAILAQPPVVSTKFTEAPALPPRPAHRTPYLWLSLILLVALIVGAILLHPDRLIRATTVLANNRALAGSRPLTAPTGIFSWPSFSPDGAKLAYTWRSTSGENPGIYLQNINSSDRTRITSSKGRDLAPAWSPDGSQLAYLHSDGDSLPVQIFLVDLAHPSSHRLITTVSGFTSAFRGAPSLAWSKDGKWLLTTDREENDDSLSLFLIDPITGHKRRLTHASPRTVDDNATFSPDGNFVAFRRSFGSSLDDIYILPSQGGEEPRRLTFEKHSLIEGLAWNPDGRSVIISLSIATSVGSLWRIPIDGGPAVPITAPLIHTSSPAVSATARRLAYIDRVRNVSTWRMSSDGHTAPAQFIASSFLDSAADFSPDGSRIAFRSDRSGSNEIWICNSDGTGLRKLTSFNGPMTGSPRWSPDGQSIAFDSRAAGRADIYLLKISESFAPVRLTTGEADSVVPNWSSDSRFIYFGSNRTGGWQIWRRNISSGKESQITHNGGFNGIESSDGKYLYYVRDAARTSLWRLSLETGNEKEIVKELGPGMWGYWTLVDDTLYYLQHTDTNQPQAGIFRLDLASGRTDKLGITQYALNSSDKGLTVSPDGKWLLYAQLDVNRSNIMLTENWQ
jgi:Tol biopolymer transport system component/DNA-binding winged helix-turn-helix (wHTH) protein